MRSEIIAMLLSSTYFLRGTYMGYDQVPTEPWGLHSALMGWELHRVSNTTTPTVFALTDLGHCARFIKPGTTRTSPGCRWPPLLYAAGRIAIEVGMKPIADAETASRRHWRDFGSTFR